jgi:uncharacterized protein (UPF0218 family)
MATKYNITPELRTKLKQPLGKLIRGSFVETMRRFRDMVDKEKPQNIVSVGDTVSRNLVKNHFLPKLSIIDNKRMRKRVSPTLLAADKTVYVKNPQGTITEEAISAIQDALKGNQHVKMIVEGEEDLLTLIAITDAPENSFIVYGQPYEGIVVVKVTPDKKGEAAEILRAMEKSSKD